MSSIEIEVPEYTEDGEIDEERVERLVNTEFEIQEKHDRPEPHKKSLFSLISDVSSPSPLTAEITNVDSNNNRITVTYVYDGNEKTKRFKTDSVEFANLMAYCGLQQHEVLELPGNTVPVLPTRRECEMSIPKNMALWSRGLHKLLRIGYRMNFIEQNISGFKMSTWGVAWVALLQIIPIFTIMSGLASAFDPNPEGGGGFIIGLILIVSILASIGGLLIVGAISFFKVHEKLFSYRSEYRPY